MYQTKFFIFLVPLSLSSLSRRYKGLSTQCLATNLKHIWNFFKVSRWNETLPLWKQFFPNAAECHHTVKLLLLHTSTKEYSHLMSAESSGCVEMPRVMLIPDTSTFCLIFLKSQDIQQTWRQLYMTCWQGKGLWVSRGFLLLYLRGFFSKYARNKKTRCENFIFT